VQEPLVRHLKFGFGFVFLICVLKKMNGRGAMALNGIFQEISRKKNGMCKPHCNFIRVMSVFVYRAALFCFVQLRVS
jgi:hypothetical protein